jgi:hypothetical protein
VEAVTEYAMQTPDGAWRVEVVKRGPLALASDHPR